MYFDKPHPNYGASTMYNGTSRQDGDHVPLGGALITVNGSSSNEMSPSTAVITPSGPPTSSSSHPTPTSPTFIDDFNSYFNREDLDVLASDLTNLVATIMYESNFTHSEEEHGSLGPPNFGNVKPPLSSPTNPIMRANYHKASTPNGGTIPKNIPIDFISLLLAQEGYYLEEFYHDFALVVMPFMPYDEAAGGYYNSARDILLMGASKEPFLLAVILAQGAKMAFAKNNLAKDEEAYCKYLSRCLNLLRPALNKTNDLTLGSDIENVLLTVLLLTSANASNIKQNWRPHLKGAKDLLLKYTSHIPHQSKVLIFCKAWFLSFEVLAGLSSQRGGTLNHNELDILMKLDDTIEVETLKEIGLLTDNGFNYFFGFHHHLLPTAKNLIKFLSSTRDKTLAPPSTFDILDMLTTFNQFNKVRFVHNKLTIITPNVGALQSPTNLKDGALPEPETMPPIPSGFPPGCLLDPQNGRNNSTITINWIDLTHHAYTLAGMITILTKAYGLSCDDDLVKPITDELIDLILFFNDIPKPKFMKWAQLMIQWPMLVGGLNCTTPKQKALVETFFATTGSGSATFWIKIINNLWNKRMGRHVSDSEVEIDLVTY